MGIHIRAFYFIIILAVLAICNICSAQNEDYFDPTGAVRSELEAAVAARFGSGFEIMFAIMDSLLSRGTDIRDWPREEVTDPYGTLRGCIFFSARKFVDEPGVEIDTCITGVYKNGQIVWDNSPGSKDGIGWSILTAKDINNDGEVDILTPSWSEAFLRTNGDNITFLSILSWNGSRGRFINDVNTDPEDVGGSTYLRSTVISEDGVFETLDSDGDGILEIRGQVGEDWLEDFPNYRTTTTPYVTYGWNGSKYGLWPSVRQVSRNEFLPANLLSVAFKCIVFPSDSGFVYSYFVTNSVGSKQRIQRFFLSGIRQLASSFAPPSWLAGSSRYLEGRVFFELSVGRMATIAPGESKSGFGVISSGLPSIVRYYVQGLTAGAPFVSDEERRNDILNNSVTGYTLGVADTVRPAATPDFLDTLSAYTTQSRSLGWITTQAVADKYLGYLTSAKTKLQQRDTASARTVLESVIREVNVDSSSTLTSEAYALLRYNTEYLLDRLPRPKQLTIDDLISLKHEAYARGWIGDEHFVKELDNGLENAKKHLARGDSVNCAKELEKFQEKVKKEYDKTVENQKKNKPRDKRFVTEEGYLSLTKAAQAIIDRLRQKKKR